MMVSGIRVYIAHAVAMKPVFALANIVTMALLKTFGSKIPFGTIQVIGNTANIALEEVTTIGVETAGGM